jgi:hypothetical protein
MDLQTGRFYHFPAGTYAQQMEKELGEAELFLMGRIQKTLKAFTRRDRMWDSELDKKFLDQDMKLFKSLGY